MAKKVLITGTSGFIGFHLANSLLNEGVVIQGYDGLTDYYDVELKLSRNHILSQTPLYYNTQGMLEDQNKLESIAKKFKPEMIVHLAAQAGVRYSLENPRAYLDSNIVGTFNVLEISRKLKVKHLLIASTSSVYGANFEMPFKEIDKSDTQLTIYSASKKASESMAHSYAHLWKIPTTIFRFFTVYGPWGRPDMALHKFVTSIIKDEPINIYNRGNMYRDFTYIDDLVNSIKLLMNCIPKSASKDKLASFDSLSPVAPYRIVNIGNSNKVKLINFVEIIEEILGKKAIKNYMPVQKGDVISTLADTSLLKHLTEYETKTNIREGIGKYIDWYLKYYKVEG